MKTMRRTMTLLVAMLFCTPLIFAQDLSKYRNFSLGTNLIQLAKQIDEKPTDASAIHQRPALIQELTWWPVQSYQSPEPSEPVQEIRFGFYNGELYRMVVTYDQQATAGMTADDMVRAVSTLYGTATRPAAEINFPTKAFYNSEEKVIARWQDSEDSVSLFRTNGLDSFGLVVLSKRLDAAAGAAIVESVKLDKEEAPQKEAARQKNEANSLAAERQIHRETFRP
ncbi:MAG: hypothetical protein ACRD4C_08650 [Candidatus Acidiferrales bacterium]